MDNKNILCLSGIIILFFGIYIVARSVFVSEKIKKFYSNYPIIRYVGEKQLTSRPCFVRVFGVILMIIGFLGFLQNLQFK